MPGKNGYTVSLLFLLVVQLLSFSGLTPAKARDDEENKFALTTSFEVECPLGKKQMDECVVENPEHEMCTKNLAVFYDFKPGKPVVTQQETGRGYVELRKISLGRTLPGRVIKTMLTEHVDSKKTPVEFLNGQKEPSAVGLAANDKITLSCQPIAEERFRSRLFREQVKTETESPCLLELTTNDHYSYGESMSGIFSSDINCMGALLPLGNYHAHLAINNLARHPEPELARRTAFSIVAGISLPYTLKILEKIDTINTEELHGLESYVQPMTGRNLYLIRQSLMGDTLFPEGFKDTPDNRRYFRRLSKYTAIGLRDPETYGQSINPEAGKNSLVGLEFRNFGAEYNKLGESVCLSAFAIQEGLPFMPFFREEGDRDIAEISGIMDSVSPGIFSIPYEQSVWSRNAKFIGTEIEKYCLELATAAKSKKCFKGKSELPGYQTLAYGKTVDYAYNVMFALPRIYRFGARYGEDRTLDVPGLLSYPLVEWETLFANIQTPSFTFLNEKQGGYSNESGGMQWAKPKRAEFLRALTDIAIRYPIPEPNDRITQAYPFDKKYADEYEEELPAYLQPSRFEGSSVRTKTGIRKFTPFNRLYSAANSFITATGVIAKAEMA